MDVEIGELIEKARGLMSLVSCSCEFEQTDAPCPQFKAKMSLEEQIQRIVDASELDDFKTLLNNHDWLYQLSDDPNASRLGAEVNRQLRSIAARRGGEYLLAFNKKQIEANDTIDVGFGRKPNKRR